MYKYWQLIPFTIPLLVWGDCIGDWTNGSGNNLWKDGANWNMTGVGCGSIYPGSNEGGAVARFSNGIGANVILDGFPIVHLSSVQVTSPASYIISGTEAIRLQNASIISVADHGSLSFEVPINDLLGDPIELFVEAPGGSFSTREGLIKIMNIDLNGISSTPGSWTNIDNTNFAITDIFSINSSTDGNVSFTNQSIDADAKVSATSLSIGKGTSTSYDYGNINSSGTSNTTAVTTVDSVVFKRSTLPSKSPPILTIINEQPILSPLNTASILSTRTLTGDGTINIQNNNASIGEQAIGAKLEVTQPDRIETAPDWNVKNSGPVVSQATGAELSHAGSVTMTGGSLTAMNLTPVKGKGAVITVGSLIQQAGTVVIGTDPSLDLSLASGAHLQATDEIAVSGGTFRIDGTATAGNTFSSDSVSTVLGSGKIIASKVSLNSKIQPVTKSPGILTFVSPVSTLGADNIVEIDVLNASGPGSAGYSQLVFEGAAVLGGTLDLVLEPTGQVNCNDQLVVVLATEGITNQFSNVTLSNFPLNFSPDIAYDGSSAIVTLLCQNCCTLPCYLGNFTQVLFSSITETNNFLIKRELQRLQQRIQAGSSQTEKANVYVGPIGSVGNSKQVDSQVGFDYWSAGAVIGTNYALSQGGLGAQVLYENIQSEQRRNGWGHFRTQRVHGDLYGSYVPVQLPELSVDLMVGGGYDWYQIRREPTRFKGTENPNGYELDALISFEYMWTQDHYHIIPMVNLQYAYLHVNEYSEFYGFTYQSQRARSLSTILGLWGDYTWQWKQPLTLQLNMGWQREYLQSDRQLHYSCKQLCLPGAEHNNLLAGVNLLWQLQEKWNIEASYDLIWNSKFDRNGFYLGVNRAF